MYIKLSLGKLGSGFVISIQLEIVCKIAQGWQFYKQFLNDCCTMLDVFINTDRLAFYPCNTYRMRCLDLYS